MGKSAKLHNKYGRWQIVFGVDTYPKYFENGYVSILMNRVVEDAIEQ